MAKTKLIKQPNQHDFTMEYEVDAPKEKVWQAFTDPDLAKQWLGPKKYKMTVEKWETKVGGSYKYTHEADGEKHTFEGVTVEIIPNKKYTQTFEWSGAKGHISLETLELEPLSNNRTRIKTHSVYQSVADRDGMLQGMGDSMDEIYGRLDALLKQKI